MEFHWASRATSLAKGRPEPPAMPSSNRGGADDGSSRAMAVFNSPTLLPWRRSVAMYHTYAIITNHIPPKNTPSSQVSMYHMSSFDPKQMIIIKYHVPKVPTIYPFSCHIYIYIHVHVYIYIYTMPALFGEMTSLVDSGNRCT